MFIFSEEIKPSVLREMTLNIGILKNFQQFLKCFLIMILTKRTKWNAFLLNNPPRVSSRDVSIDLVLQKVKLVVLNYHEFANRELYVLLTFLAFSAC